VNILLHFERQAQMKQFKMLKLNNRKCIKRDIIIHVKMKRIILLLLMLSLGFHSFSQPIKDNLQYDWEKIEEDAIAEAENGWWKASMENHDERIQWWRDARFGCFVHWGVYANIAGVWKGTEYAGYAEHSQRYFRIDQEAYLNDVIQEFNPVNFDADQWIQKIKEAGMKYFIITAKHHDGFAMYDSDVSDYNIIDQTPFKRDPMMELKKACTKYGIKFGFYYSQAFDWGEKHGAGNDWEFNRPGGDKKLYNDRKWYIERPDLYKEIQEKYTNVKAIPQIKELIRKYDPDILWFDTSHKLPFWENLRMLEEIRKLSNKVVVNGRLARSVGQNYGDYINTGDRAAEFSSKDGDWEGIPTTNESYGYSKVDKNHKKPQFFIQLIAKAASRNGNLLMNIGPKADGTFDSADVVILEDIGKWMNKYGESIYGTSNSALPIQNWGVTTQKSNKLFLHVFDWPKDGKLVAGGLKSVPAKAYILDQSNQKLDFKKENKLDIVLDVGNKAPDKNNSVVVLEMNKPIEVDSSRLLEVNNMNRLLFFDAKLEGRNADKLGYADGKANRFYITNWTDKEQWFSWNVRVNEPAVYDLILHYYRDSITGSVSVSLDGKPVLKNINPVIHMTSSSEPCAKVSIGHLELMPGKYTIIIKPESQPKGEVMKPLEIELQPL